MHSFSLAFTVVCPLFLMMALGYALRCVGLFSGDFPARLNTLCFRVFLPLILFVNVYQSDFSAAFQPRLILFAVGSIAVLFAVLLLLVPRLSPQNTRRGVLVQGIFRSNFVLFGLPLTASLFGPSGAGTAAVLISFAVPLFNLLSVVTLEIFRGEAIKINRLLRGVLTNPLILGALAAFFFVLTGFRLPPLLENTITDISKIATPLSLIVLGGSFTFGGLRGNGKALWGAVCGRLVLVPAVFMALAVALGFRGAALGALLAMFASPTAVSSFTMAQQMQADDVLAGQIVVITSLCSVLSIFVWIFLLNAAGLFGISAAV
ncbi:MAG: AEC family transporter [Ruthenibacterium sp.]